MNHRQPKAYSLAAILGLLFLISHVGSALAQNYTLNSLFSINSGLPQLPAFAPSINNSGKVAHVRRTNNPFIVEQVIFIHDGTSETAFFNLTTAGFSTGHNVVINDNGAVGVLAFVSSCPGNPFHCLIRINPDQSVTILATFGAFGGGTADIGGSINTDIISMNNLGQVAVKVTYNNGTIAIVRIDDNGITEIARTGLTQIYDPITDTVTTATLINFTTASINNSGVVAFAAQDISCQPINCDGVFSGTGG